MATELYRRIRPVGGVGGSPTSTSVHRGKPLLMSYDLYFLPPHLCSDPNAAVEQLEAGGSPDESNAAPTTDVRKRSLVAALQRKNPQLKSFPLDFQKLAELDGSTVEQARARHDHVELNGPEDGNGIQIMVFRDHASITVPYWHGGSGAESVFDELQRYASILVGEGGYRVFDPQLDRVVDDLDEIRAEILAQYGDVMARMPDIVASTAKRTKPWWKFW